MMGRSSFFYKKIDILNLSKKLAMLSICVYIILVIVFEAQESNLSRYASLGIYFCLAMCAVYIVIRKTVRFDWIIVPLVIFGVILSISALYTSASSELVSTYIYRYWTTVILLFAILNALDNDGDIQIVWISLIISGVLMAIFMYQYYGLENLIGASERLDTELGNQNITGARCSLAIVVSVYMFLTTKNKNRWVFLLPVIICLPAVLFTGSRKSIFIIVVAICFMVLMYNENIKNKIGNSLKKIFLILFAVSFMFIIIYSVPAFSMIKGRFEEMILGLLGQGSLNEGDILRQYYIETGLAEFKESPIWGNGFYYSAYLFGHYSHNNYIELLMNNGIIGFIAYYSIYIKLLIDAFKMKTTFHKSYVLIVLVVFVFLALDLGTVSYFDRYTLLILAVCSRIFVTNEYKNRLTVE